MQDNCIGIYMAAWFAAFLPFTYIWHFSPCYLSPTPHPPHCPSPISPQQTPVCDAPSLCLFVLIVQHPLMSENMWCLVFCSCVSLLRMVVSRFIHVPAKTWTRPFYGCIVCHGVYVPHFFIQSIVDGHLSWFQVFAIVNSAAINVHVHVSF